jgi:hypothetical protein
VPAVTDTGFVEMRLGKVVGVGSAGGGVSCVVVLDGVSEAEAERQGDSAEAILLRRALEAGQMTVRRAPRDP